MSETTMAKSVLWNTLGNIFYYVCQWVMTVLVVRLATYEAAGYFSLAMTTSSTFLTIGLFSMRNFQVSDIQHEFSQNEYLGSRIFTCTIALLLCMINSLFATNLYQLWTINAFMLIRLAEGYADVLHGIFQEYNRYDWIGKSFLLRGLFTIAIFTGTLLIGKDVLAAIVLVAAANLCCIIFFDLKHTKRVITLHPIIFNKRIVLLLKKCVPLVITGFLLAYMPQFIRQQIQKHLGNQILGIYGSIASPTMVIQLLAAYIFNPFIPRLSELIQDCKYEVFRKVFYKLWVILFVFGITMLILSACFGKIALEILYGASILNYADMLLPLVGVTLVTGYAWIMIALVTIIRKTRIISVGIGLSTCICIAFAMPIMNEFGINGASYILIISFTLFNLFCSGVILFATNFRCKDSVL